MSHAWTHVTYITHQMPHAWTHVTYITHQIPHAWTHVTYITHQMSDTLTYIPYTRHIDTQGTHTTNHRRDHIGHDISQTKTGNTPNITDTGTQVTHTE